MINKQAGVSRFNVLRLHTVEKGKNIFSLVKNGERSSHRRKSLIPRAKNKRLSIKLKISYTFAAAFANIITKNTTEKAN